MLLQTTGVILGTNPQGYRQLGVPLQYMEQGRSTSFPWATTYPLIYSKVGALDWKQARAWLWEGGGKFQKLRLVPVVQEQYRVGHWQAWTRAILADFTQRSPSPLMWIAMQHPHPALPHVHIVLAYEANANGSFQWHLSDYQFLWQRSKAHLLVVRPLSMVVARRVFCVKEV